MNSVSSFASIYLPKGVEYRTFSKVRVSTTNFIWHVGLILDDDTVWHQSFLMRNQFGGSLIIQDRDDFFKGRKLFYQSPVFAITEVDLTKIFNEYRSKTWTVFHSCESLGMEFVSRSLPKLIT